MHYLFLLVYMHGLIYSRRSTYYWPIRLNFGRCEEMASLSAINGARKCHAGYIRVAFVSWRVNLPRGSRYYNSRNKDASHGATITRQRGVRICISILFGLGSNLLRISTFYFSVFFNTYDYFICWSWNWKSFTYKSVLFFNTCDYFICWSWNWKKIKKASTEGIPTLQDLHETKSYWIRPS